MAALNVARPRCENARRMRYVKRHRLTRTNPLDGCLLPEPLQGTSCVAKPSHAAYTSCAVGAELLYFRAIKWSRFMKTVRVVLALFAISMIAPWQSAKAADVICYNCPPEWADWASMLKAIKADLNYDVP